MLNLFETGTTLAAAGQNQAVLPGENISNEVAEIATRTYLDKSSDSLFIEVANRFPEAHLARPLAQGQFSNFRWCWRERTRRSASVELGMPWSNSQPLIVFPESFCHLVKQGRMVGTIKGQTGTDSP